MDQRFILYEQIKELAASRIPFHMPGHKRQTEPCPGLPFCWDITEIEGADDLHRAGGILKEAMERTAALFGAARTWYLVNGSSCGNLSAVMTAVPFGGELIAGVNCHRSVYHAMELGHLKPHFVTPPRAGDFHFYGSITPEQIRDALEEFPDAAAVVLTSPTYEGVVSDIAGIAKMCHEHGKILIVDEAHGAHLAPAYGLSADGFGFPDSALHLGADIVVQSAHKTLPSMTQTSLLHLSKEGSARIDEEKLEHMLDVFESSSPSYPLMCSLDGCTGILREEGNAFYAAWSRRLREFDQRMSGLRHLRIPGHTIGITNVFAYDPGKILIDPGDLQLTGVRLKGMLAQEFGLELEMCCEHHALAMTSLCDSDEMMQALAEALTAADALNAVTRPANKSTIEEEHFFTPGVPDVITNKGGAASPGRECIAESEIRLAEKRKFESKV